MSIFTTNKKDYEYDDNYDANFYHAGQDEGEISENAAAAPAEAAQKTTVPTGNGALKVVKPNAPEDGLVIADYLMNGFTVVMNIEELDRSITVRLIDFLQGALHVLDGELRRVTKTTFVLTPRKGVVSEEVFGGAEN